MFCFRHFVTRCISMWFLLFRSLLLHPIMLRKDLPSFSCLLRGMHTSMLLPEWAIGRALWGMLNITTRSCDRRYVLEMTLKVLLDVGLIQLGRPCPMAGTTDSNSGMKVGISPWQVYLLARVPLSCAVFFLFLLLLCCRD